MNRSIKIAIPSMLGVGTAGSIVGGYYYLNPSTTIKDVLIKKIRLTTEFFPNNIWEIAFNENKDSEELIKIKPKITNFNQLKIWCIDNYKKSSSNKDILEKVEKLCEFPPTTISDKLEKDKKKFVSNWDDKFNNIKSNSDQLARLKTIDATFSAEVGKDKLKQWCNNQKIIELIPQSYQENYKKIVEFCT